MTLDEIRDEIARLPERLLDKPAAESAPVAPVSKEGSGARAAAPSPLDVVSRQGRLLLRLAASSESVEGRVRDLARVAERQGTEIEALRAENRRARERADQFAMETIRLIDTLDRIHAALSVSNSPVVQETAAAQRDAARRLAALGVTEIPCAGAADGRLHESVETVAAPVGTPRYSIVSVVRRGWQCGPDILRRACVVTAD